MLRLRFRLEMLLLLLQGESAERQKKKQERFGLRRSHPRPSKSSTAGLEAQRLRARWRIDRRQQLSWRARLL